jgi:hypothetical protein
MYSFMQAKEGSVNNSPIARHCKRDVQLYAGQGRKSKKALFSGQWMRENRMLFMTGAWNILYKIVGKKDLFYFI